MQINVKGTCPYIMIKRINPQDYSLLDSGGLLEQVYFCKKIENWLNFRWPLTHHKTWLRENLFPVQYDNVSPTLLCWHHTHAFSPVDLRRVIKRHFFLADFQIYAHIYRIFGLLQLRNRFKKVISFLVWYWYLSIFCRLM